MKWEIFQEYLATIACFLGFHRYTDWVNGSKFIDNGGWSFGWVCRYEKTCTFCGRKKFRKPFLKSECGRLINEALAKQKESGV